eukprot:CAMPEP_0119132724 /NCGR_PEP_ID=MMETSP1310-20130426/12167_1 /TAXON_ID=464262 /ORGANISM="Genus nov. species nov., Strain RCC2339" /LENGTH=344 /DNA_ID=CAMNT_0007123375 /DNA_START=92 /DNA_END=1126 /DNA_ORIENTATION=+
MLGAVQSVCRGVTAGVGVRSFSQSASLYGRSLVFAEQVGGKVSGGSLSAINAANQMSSDGVTVAVFGTEAAAAAEELKAAQGVTKVLFCNDAKYDNAVAEDVADALFALQEQDKYSNILGSTSALAKSALPRLSGLLDVSQISEIVEVKSENTFVRPIYAGNALATVESKDDVRVVTVRGTSFDPPGSQDGSGVEVAEVNPATDNPTKFVRKEVQESERPDLGSADVVVSGGRGLKNGENFQMLYDLADQLGAAVGASRAAVDAGFVPNDMQVGQTGKIVAPNLYIAVGISGAIQHLAGMKDSKTIVAINKDPEAPIFQVSDVGLVADLFQAVPELTEKIKASK